MVGIKIAKSKKCNGDYSMYVSTVPYDNRVVELVRALPERYWDKDNKIWEVNLKSLPKMVEGLPQCDIELSGQYVSFEKQKVSIPDGFQFKTEPYEHQLVGFDYGLNNDKWLLGDEMGLGKTKQVIDIAIAKKQLKGYKHCLIICGVNGLKWNWLNEIRSHSEEFGWILGMYHKNYKNKWDIGSNVKKLEDVMKIGNDNHIDSHYFLLTNVETLRDEAIAKKLSELCKDGTIGMVAFDECHKAKNPLSQQGKGILKLQADTMIAMTGTPLMNQPFDLYIILKWLGYEKHAFGAFKNHYAEFGGFGGYQVIGYRYLDELQERLNEIMLRRRKEEVLDLPEKTYINEFVEMTPRQKQVYDEVTSDIKMHIDEIKMANNPLAELIRMRQATGYTGILSSTVKESAKLDRMKELIDEALENDKQVVVFSNWTQMTDAIMEKLVGYKYGIITGQTPDADRQTIIDKFQDGTYKIVIGTSGAMGTGVTLTAGTVEIFMDEPWNMALKEQCVDRCHRIGQQSNLTIYTLMCKDTIDERIHEIVERKGKMADSIIDGKVAVDNSQLLDYLLG